MRQVTGRILTAGDTLPLQWAPLRCPHSVFPRPPGPLQPSPLQLRPFAWGSAHGRGMGAQEGGTGMVALGQ